MQRILWPLHVQQHVTVVAQEWSTCALERNHAGHKRDRLARIAGAIVNEGAIAHHFDLLRRRRDQRVGQQCIARVLIARTQVFGRAVVAQAGGRITAADQHQAAIEVKLDVIGREPDGLIDRIDRLLDFALAEMRLGQACPGLMHSGPERGRLPQQADGAIEFAAIQRRTRFVVEQRGIFVRGHRGLQAGLVLLRLGVAAQLAQRRDSVAARLGIAGFQAQRAVVGLQCLRALAEMIASHADIESYRRIILAQPMGRFKITQCIRPALQREQVTLRL